MHSSFLVSFASVLCVAAVTSLIFQRLRLPLVLGYLLAGVLLGPSTGLQSLISAKDVHTLAELGVILLMFALGLEFSLRDLAKAGARSGAIALFEIMVMMWLGFLAARALGFAPLPAFFVASLLAISSTTLIVRVFADAKPAAGVRQLVLGVLVFEDLIAILLLASLTTLSQSSSFSFDALLYAALRLLGYLIAFLLVGMLVVPRLMRVVLKLNRSETTLVAGLGLAFAGALCAQAMGYSVALGAFLAGSLAAQAGATHRLEPLVVPIRDVFVAVFFVAIGLSVDVTIFVTQPLLLLGLSLLVIVGKLIGVTMGAFATGKSLQESLQAGLSMGQIGEFSFIIAGLAATLPGCESLLAVAVGVSTITAICTPSLVKHNQRIAQAVERKLPHPVQTFMALYASWIEAMQKNRAMQRSQLKTRAWQLAVDLALIIVIIIGTQIFDQRLQSFFDERMGLAARSVSVLVLVTEFALLAPLLWGAAKLIGSISHMLASATFKARREHDVDFAAAPRKAFRLSLLFGLSATCGLLVIVATQAFLPAGSSTLVFMLLMIWLGISVFHGARDLHGHVRAGASALFEVLIARGLDSTTHATSPSATPGQAPDHLSDAEQLLPGLGELHALFIHENAKVAGKKLGEIGLRGQTGAAIILIRRGEQAITSPLGAERVLAGDQVVLSGSKAAVLLAEQVLTQT
jgi:monovalent cation:H+ antiporter-2, CPA2 family